MMVRGENTISAGREAGRIRSSRSPLVLSLAALTMFLMAPGLASAQVDLGIYGGGGGGGAADTGAPANGGAGGAGGTGDAVTVGEDGSDQGDPIKGGDGGNSGLDGALQSSGASTVTDPGTVTTPAPGGGAGGSITFTLNRNIASSANGIEIIAGNGGDGGDAPIAGANGDAGVGGQGGSVALTGRPYTITMNAQSLAIASGAGGAEGANTGGAGANGGDVTVTLGTLSYVGDGDLNVAKGAANNALGGKVQIDINTLQVTGVTAGDQTVLNSTGTRVNADDMVKFGTLKLVNGGQGASFTTADAWNGTGTGAGNFYNFSNLYVAGSDNAFETDSGSGASTNQYAPGAKSRLTFDLSGVAAGDTMLTATNGNTGGIPGDNDGISLDLFDSDNMTMYTTYNNAVAHNGQANAVDLIVGASDGTHLAGDRVYAAYGTLGVAEYYLGYDDTGAGTLSAFTGGIYDDAYAINLQSNAAALMTARDGYRTVFTTLNNFVETEENNKVLLKATIDGGSFQNRTDGGRLDNDIFNFNLGLGYKGQTGMGQTTIGAFFEAGSGSYDASQQSTFYGEIHGDGQTEHYGGGLMFHNEFANRLYIEATGRAGRIDNQFGLRYDNRRGLIPGIRGGANFDTDNNYYGAHFGLGYKYDITDLCEIDFYGKFLWTRLDSDDFRNEAGEFFQMDAADSLRSQLGFRITQSYMESAQGGYDLKGYVGAAWEHEFDGQVSGRIDGRQITSPHGEPELKGSSILGEAGLIIQPAGASYAVDLGIFGSGGQQRGLGGTAALKFEF